MNPTNQSTKQLLHPAMQQLLKLAQVSALDLHVAEIILANSPFSAQMPEARLQPLALLLIMLGRQTVSQADVCLNLDEISKQLALGELQHRLSRLANNHAALLQQLADARQEQSENGENGENGASALQAQLERELQHYCLLQEWCQALKKPEEILAGLPATLLQQNTHEQPEGTQAVLILQKRRLYFARSYYFENLLAEQIRQRSAQVHTARQGLQALDSQQLEQLVKQTVSGFTLEQEQMQAVCMALQSNFCIVTGGPGTGKTTIISVIIALLLQQDPELTIMLSAPTGKAQARMQESIIAELDNLQTSPQQRAKMSTLQCATIHRLLGMRPNSNSTRYHQNNPLHCDVLIVDEASMIKQELMARLLCACPPQAKLIIIGDRFQLASIEAGCVLADLCRLFAGNPERLCELKVSKRFDPRQGIGRFREMLASAEAGSNAAAILAQIHQLNAADPEQKHFHYFAEEGELSPAYVQNRLEIELRRDANGNGWLGEQHSFRHADSLQQAWQQFESLRLLSAVNEGPYGVEQLNALCRQILGFYPQGAAHGLPLIINSNHPASGLFNGDLGMFWYARKDGAGNYIPCSLQQAMQPHQACELLAYFPRLDRQGHISWQALSPAQLPQYGDAFAMTIHKSQGSGYNKVLVWLGYTPNRLLIRELLYTAVTRARHTAYIYAGDQSIKSAVVNVTKRYSGLCAALEG